MLVKVYIKRQFKEGSDKEAFSLLKKIRSAAIRHEGYISGETLVSTEDFNVIMVVSTWQSLDEWNSWKSSEERKVIDDQLEKLQTSPTKYESFVFSKHRLSVKTDFQEFRG